MMILCYVDALQWLGLSVIRVLVQVMHVVNFLIALELSIRTTY